MRGTRRLLGPAVAAVLVAGLGWRVGPAAVGEALRSVDPAALGLALGAGVVVAAVTTVCAAWRWALVARALGLELSLRDAVAASYRAQFLNATLPAGVAGDVHRGVVHGRSSDDVGRGVRAVVWERTAGQVVQVALTVGVLLAVPSPLRAALTGRGPALAAGLLVAGLLVAALSFAVVARARLRTGTSRAVALLRTLVDDVRHGLLARRVWPGVVAASTVAVAGHVVTFLLAVRAAGVAAPTARLVPVALVVLLAAALPLNVAGWGPREGAAVWAFGAAGLGTGPGVVAAAVFGALVLVACLPGAAVLVRGSVGGARA